MQIYLPHRRKAFQAAPGGSNQFSDDMADDSTADWNEVDIGGGGSVMYFDTDHYVIDNTVETYTPTQCATTTQFAYVKSDGNFNFFGPMVRSQNSTANAYALRTVTAGDFVLRSIQGVSGVEDHYTWTTAWNSGEWFGLTVTGTGATGTTFGLYRWAAASSDPGAYDGSNWDSSATDSQAVTSTEYGTITNLADSGLYCGLYSGQNVDKSFAHFGGGDW